MPGRKNYENAVRALCAEVEAATGQSPLEYISRPGGGEPPRYVFLMRTCLGGREALEYAQGLAEAARLVAAFKKESQDA